MHVRLKWYFRTDRYLVYTWHIPSICMVYAIHIPGLVIFEFCQLSKKQSMLDDEFKIHVRSKAFQNNYLIAPKRHDLLSDRIYKVFSRYIPCIYYAYTTRRWLASPGELKLTESKMLLSLHFVLESSFVSQYLWHWGHRLKNLISDSCFVLSGTHQWYLLDAFGEQA